MLVEFTMRNFMSYKDEVTLSMVASATVKECESSEGSSNVSVLGNGKRYLRSAAIYGANGSGKSSIIMAIAIFKQMVLSSFVDEKIVKDLSCRYYRFAVGCASEPVSMQMIFLHNGLRYRLGFEVVQGVVRSEWLYVLLNGSNKESYCFKRDGQDIKVNSKVLKGAGGVSSRTRTDALFLSTAAQFNVEVALSIKNWFSNHLTILSGLDDTLAYTAETFMQNTQIRNQILRLINIVDSCIKEVNVERLDGVATQNLPFEIRATHEMFEKDNVIGSESLDFKFESLGTTKLFALLGPFLTTILHGGVLLVDEFGASMHTQLSMELLKLFYSTMNMNGAQLIVTTHDTNLLRRDLLRRDQIWFSEKNEKGFSDLYSLVEYKVNQANSVRNDASFSKDYLLGRYGAIPYFGNLDKFIMDYGNKKEE